MKQNKFVTSTLSNLDKASTSDINKVLELAKEAYYNTGEELISDTLYDELEKKVGLENVNYVGTKHNPSYVIKHPFTMGSLSKVQVHEKDGVIDWDEYYNSANKYYKLNPVIITPKFDGCSWELIMDMYGDIISISSRGDGEYGKDLRKHLESKFDKKFLRGIVETTYNLWSDTTQIVLRGEALVKKSVWETSFKDRFVNTRAMASGILNHDYDDNDKDFQNILDNLDVVCYFVAVNGDNHNFMEVDWTDYVSENTKHLMPNFYIEYPRNKTINSSEEFENIYNKFNEYRSKCEYPLDGIVIKPIRDFRTAFIDEHRPSDSVAIKFIPQLQETTIRSVDWNIGKTGEMIPTVVFDPVAMDGKTVTRASAHNYGYLIANKVSIGTKIIVSLAGDIIPFIYKVTDSSKFDEKKIGLICENTHIDGCHLMYDANEDEVKRNYLFNTLVALNIDKLGPENARKAVEYINEKCKPEEGLEMSFFVDEVKSSELPNHALMIDPIDFGFALGGKIGVTVEKNFMKMLKDITLEEIISSCNFKLCGNKVAKQIANKLLGLPYDFTSMASVAYYWIEDKTSDEYKLLIEILNHLGKTFDDFKKTNVIESADNTPKIPIILTGEPNNYSSKGEFLKYHPEYEVTGSWKKCQIVFTNSIESTTGKMKNAKQLGVDIRLY
jgi:hypothetical protein